MDSKTAGEVNFRVSVNMNVAVENSRSIDTDVPGRTAKLTYCFEVPSFDIFLRFICSLIFRAKDSSSSSMLLFGVSKTPAASSQL